MEELELQDRPGLLSRFTGWLGRERVDDEEAEASHDGGSPVYQLRAAYRYSVSIRKDIGSFDDAYSAANGLKRGEQQILNLTTTDPVLRQKIVDFMAGVAFAQEANWESIGDHIYLVAPASSYVEVVPGDSTSTTKFSGTFFSN